MSSSQQELARVDMVQFVTIVDPVCGYIYWRKVSCCPLGMRLITLAVRPSLGFVNTKFVGGRVFSVTEWCEGSWRKPTNIFFNNERLP